MSRRQWLLIAFTATIFVILGGFGVWSITNPDHKHQPTAKIGPIATPSIKAHFTNEMARQLESRLTSRDLATYQSAWAHSNVPPMTPVDTTIRIDVNSFTLYQGLGRVRAVGVLPGKSPQSWQLLLRAKNGCWSVVAIREVN